MRSLNAKLDDIFSATVLEDSVVNEDLQSSQEISQLIKLFQGLISNKKFTNNNFLSLPDALAVIDLAEACNMFDEMKNVD